MDTPIYWEELAVAWTEDGYVFEVGLDLDDRAGLCFRSRFTAAMQWMFEVLNDDDAPLGMRLSHGPPSRGASGTATLELRSPRLLELPPDQVRATLDHLALECKQLAEREGDRDERNIAAWVSRINTL